MCHSTNLNTYQLIVSIIFRGVFRTLPCQKSMMKLFLKVHNTVDTGRPGRLLNVLYTFNLRLLSTGNSFFPLATILKRSRSSRSQIFFKTGVLKNFLKVYQKTSVFESLDNFLIKLLA